MAIPIENVMYLWKRNILRFVSVLFFINKSKVGYLCVSGSGKHTRGLGAVLEMEIPKEKIKNLIILFWSSWSQVLKISIHLNFLANDIKISQI